MDAPEQSDTASPARRYATSWLGWLLIHTPLDRVLRQRLAHPCYALSVDDDGIREFFLGQPPRLHPWETVGPVQTDGRGCVISPRLLTQYRLSWSVPGARELLTEIERHRPPEPGEVTTIEPEQVAEWLGIALDESLVVRAPKMQRNMMVISCAAVIGAVMLVVRLGPPYLAWMCLGQLGLLMLTWQNVLKRFSATPWGLRQGRKEVAWHDVLGRSVWHVQTRQGSLYLPGGENSERVVSTIQRILDARRAGAVLPRMTDVPEHALSRADSVEVSAERGISPAEDRP
jgi:hypothetical protein